MNLDQREKERLLAMSVSDHLDAAATVLASAGSLDTRELQAQTHLLFALLKKPLALMPNL